MSSNSEIEERKVIALEAISASLETLTTLFMVYVQTVGVNIKENGEVEIIRDGPMEQVQLPQRYEERFFKKNQKNP